MSVKRRYRGVEQLVARRAHNPEVVGSSPSPATNEKVPTFELPFYGVKGWDYSFIISVYYTPFQTEAEFSCSVFDAAALHYKNEYTPP